MDLEVLLIAVTFIGLSGTFCYVLRCPENKEKDLRPKYVCENPLEYHCLTNYTSKQYTETCKKSSWMVEGTYAVLNNMYINDEICIPQQFQPFVILSTDAYKCTYKKDKCAEKGQVIFSNGTASANSFCRCDYRKGYLFVTKPQQICYCNPVQEDCACVLADCGHNKELNPDYVCRNKFITKWETQTCPEITQGEREVLYEKNLTELNVYRDNKPLTSFTHRYIPAIVTLVLLVFAICVLLLEIKKGNVSKCMHRALPYMYEGCTGKQKAANPKESDDAVSESEAVPKESDDVVNECEDIVLGATKMLEKPKDIVVLGMTKEVKEFIPLLEKNMEKFNFMAGLHANDRNTPLDILLTTYQFIFILYTNNFDMSNVGLAEGDIAKIRRRDQYQIKIICNCQRDLVIEAFHRIDLDFQNKKWDDFVKEDSKYLEILKQLRRHHPKRKIKKYNTRDRRQTVDVLNKKGQRNM